jgi:hypothetical protein
MLKRRAEQAGYMGWRSRAMLDGYGEDMADRRAFDAKQQMGNLY